ncbi:hypothetical protein [Tahibacter caeni]|uniref:hypothetical protein n=1 Tax=Tahibacter caeni TaxID=1453545 RepID=UPI00214963C0|nr:hypothetical protein [Tahibacter caeni]
MRRPFAVFLIGLAALCAVPAASAAGLRLTVGPVPTIYSGTTYYFSAGIEKEDRNDGIVHHAPFTFRTTLPPGVEYAGWNGGWTCSTPPGNRRDVTCVYPTDLNFFNPASGYLQINATVVPTVTPGPVNVVATLESSEVPLPQNPTCAPSPSVTGCASAATSYVQSQIRINDWGYTNGTVTNGPVAVWTGAPFEAGTQNMLVFGVSNSGYGPANTPVTVDLDLPAGFVYAGMFASNPAFGCAAQTPPTHVRCTTPYLIDQGYGFASLRIDVAPDVAVPGPLYVHARVANDAQAAPADCVANPLQTGCGRLQVPTRAPRVPTLVGDSVTHVPATFTLGQEAGPVVVSYRNVGEGNAGATTVYVQLPPYFEYRGVFSASPAATCLSQGQVAAGAVVVCQTAGLLSGGLGWISLRLLPHAQAASPGPLPVVAAFDLATPSTTAILQSCVANPAQAFCANDAIPTFFPCALQHGDEGIFCDGFQPFVRP